MPRISLELELGIPIIYTFGEINFLNENSELKEWKIKDRVYNFNQLLNDVRISYNF